MKKREDTFNININIPEEDKKPEFATAVYTDEDGFAARPPIPPQFPEDEEDPAVTYPENPESSPRADEEPCQGQCMHGQPMPDEDVDPDDLIVDDGDPIVHVVLELAQKYGYKKILDTVQNLKRGKKIR